MVKILPLGSTTLPGYQRPVVMSSNRVQVLLR